MTDNIRNFCIISHIDHGKSTLADCFLRLTKTIPASKMSPQYLDRMDLEREHGITIKMHPVSMLYEYNNQEYILNLIDTPGHVDFSYEVSRALLSVEGAILLVDGRKGSQAQTLANFNLAKKENLPIIPVINKIDLDGLDLEQVADEMVKLFQIKKEDILYISAKTGQGTEELLKAVIERIPPPKGEIKKPFQSLIFDSFYDNFQGVVAYVRLYQGEIRNQEEVYFCQSKAISKLSEVGIFTPELQPRPCLKAGQIGYLKTGLKDISLARVGETIKKKGDEETKPLAGYKEPTAMVFASFYPKNKTSFSLLKDTLGKLKLNDASLEFSLTSHPILGQGWSIGFLGMLHLEITKERLEREYGQEVIITAPSVVYRLYLKNGKVKEIHSPSQMPEETKIDKICEPWVEVEMISPFDYYSSLLDLAKKFRATNFNWHYLGKPGSSRVVISFQMPLCLLISNFYDKVKEISSGYASYSWKMIGYRSADISKLDVHLAGQEFSQLATFVYKDEVEKRARDIAEKLKEVIPRQLYELRIQVLCGGRIVAAERIAPYGKDVTAKLYGGDVTRKRKLLEKQKKGKKKMLLSPHNLDLPTKTYLALITR